jgi:hypothetical protein
MRRDTDNGERTTLAQGLIGPAGRALDVGAVWLMVPGGGGVPEPAIAATRRTAGRIATQLFNHHDPRTVAYAIKVRTEERRWPTPRPRVRIPVPFRAPGRSYVHRPRARLACSHGERWPSPVEGASLLRK